MHTRCLSWLMMSLLSVWIHHSNVLSHTKCVRMLLYDSNDQKVVTYCSAILAWIHTHKKKGSAIVVFLIRHKWLYVFHVAWMSLRSTRSAVTLQVLSSVSWDEKQRHLVYMKKASTLMSQCNSMTWSLATVPQAHISSHRRLSVCMAWN